MSLEAFYCKVYPNIDNYSLYDAVCIYNLQQLIINVRVFSYLKHQFKSFLFKLLTKPAQKTQIAIPQTVNIAYPTDFVQDTTVNTVILFLVELVMVIVIQELVQLVLFVGMIISLSSILFFLTVQAETPKMQKFALRKVYR